MRHLLLGILLLAVYAGSTALPETRGSDYGEAEARHLLVAESLVSDRDLDVSDQYASRDHTKFFSGELTAGGRPYAGRLHEPDSPGFSILIAPAYALAGGLGVQLLCAALAALAFVVALPLARAVVPEPWATGGVLAVSLSPPAVVHATAVDPGTAAAPVLAIAVLLTVRAREDARLAPVVAAGLVLALLPWLDPLIALAGLPVAGMLLSWTLRQHRRLAALIAVELLSSSLIAFTALSEVIYGGLTPLAAAVAGDTAIGAASLEGYVDRLPRLASLWLDRDHGVIRWAPVLALIVPGTWLLWRSRRDHIARALPGRREGEATAALAVTVVAGLLLIAVLATPVGSGGWFAGHWLMPGLPLTAVPVAWSLRHLPRIGTVLGVLAVLGTAWLCAQIATGRLGGWAAAPDSRAPWGPLEAAFPLWGGGSVWPAAVTAAILAALLGLLGFEWRARMGERDRGRMTDSGLPL